MYFRLHPDLNIDSDLLLDFLRSLHRQVPGQQLLIWDRLNTHRCRATREFLEGTDYLESFLLPPYAPELNPVESVWGYEKMNPMANYAPLALDALIQTTRRSARSVQRRPSLLRSFVEHCPLPLRLN